MKLTRLSCNMSEDSVVDVSATEDLVVHVAKRMLSDMEEHGGVEDFCEKLCGFPEKYLSELAAGSIDCISLSGRLKAKP